MRLPARLAAMLAALMLPCVLPSVAAAASVLVLDDPITDNYKAAYNADPSQPENRTWLAIQSITVDGATWRPQAPGAITVTGGGVIELVAGDGRRATLTATVSSGPMASMLQRSDPTSAASGGRWGPLATVTDRSALRTTPAVVQLALAAGGTTIGTGTVSYRYDSALATAPAGNIEHNGPGGRWYVGSTATRTNEEAAPATPPSILASGVPSASPAARPRIRRVQMPLRTRSRFVPLRVFGRSVGGVRITHLRVRIDGRRWGRWVRTRARYTLVLPRGNRAHAVRFQLRDARGRTSLVVRRRIHCTCR